MAKITGKRSRLGKIVRFLWLLVVLAVMGFPDAVQAGKLPTPFIFDQADEALTTVTLYETTPETQKDTFKEIFKTSKSFYKKTPGFGGFMGLASGDGLQVLEFTQWQDKASYEAFETSLSANSYDYSKYYEKYTQTQSEESASAPPLTGKFVVDQVVAPPGLMAAIPGEYALVQISRFSPVDLTDQALVVAAIQQTLADLPQLYPAPRNVTLLVGTDIPDVLMLATWGSAPEFADPEQVPKLVVNLPVADSPGEAMAGSDGSIAMAAAVSETEAMDRDAARRDSPATVGGEPIATLDDHLFQVVKIVAAKSA
jgi:heme-degrading monooxygenase HmoA